MKRVLGIGAGIVALAVIGFFVSIPLVNDAAARAVESELLALPLPEGAELVDSMSQAAKISGNGNGMQYVGALLIRSGQQIYRIRDFYDAQNERFGTSATVISTMGSEVSALHGARGFLSEPGEPGLFIVLDWGEGPGPIHEEFDLRGH